MRTLSILAVLVTASTLLSFSTEKATDRLSKTKHSLKPPPTVFTDNQILPFSTQVYIPCAAGGAGEFVEISGNLHVVFHVTINGNNAIIKSHAQPQGISGVGMTTGLMYQATGVTQDISKSSASNGQYAYSFVNNFRIIGQGPGNNYIVQNLFHVTFNANGELTAEVDNFTSECK